MPYETQQPHLVRNLVLSANKQTTFGTALLDASLTYRERQDPGAFVSIPKQFYTDIERAGKGHAWPTLRQKTAQMTEAQINMEVDAFKAGWMLAQVLHKVATSGVGPFTHLFTFEQATRIAPVTTLYCEDTADIKFKVPDMCGVSLSISGGERGVLQAQLQMQGSGRVSDGAIGGLPALAAPALLLGSDTDILLGAPGAAASIKERVRSWSVSLASGAVQHRAPGGGMFSSFAKIGLQRATVQLAIAAKNVDDIRAALHLNDTLQELQINTNSGAAAQLNIKFPNLYFQAPTLASDGTELIWNLTASEQEVMKGAALNLVELTAINSQATYLVAA